MMLDLVYEIGRNVLNPELEQAVFQVQRHGMNLGISQQSHGGRNDRDPRCRSCKVAAIASFFIRV